MKTNGQNETPLLMISCGKSLNKHLIYNASEKWFRMLNNIPELNGKKVLGSMHGWLVLVEPTYGDEDGDCCLFNPITKHKIELPKLNYSRSYDQCILTKPPTEPDCYILFNGLEQSFCRIGDAEYVTRTLEQQQQEEEENGYIGFDNLTAIVSFQGKIYGLMHPNKFVTVHFVGKTIEFRQIPTVEPWVISRSWAASACIWLIESPQSCGGELLMVKEIRTCLNCYERLDFCVFRIDTSQIDTNRINCVEVENIGNMTIFLSRDGVGYCCPSTGTKPNSIYYTNEDDRNLYVFDLKDKGTSLMLPSRAVAANDSMSSWVQGEIFHNS